MPYKIIPLGVDNNLRCLVHGKHKDKRNVYLTKCSEKQCFIGHIINYSKTKALIVQQTILNLQTKGCFVPVVFKHSSQSMKHMKSGQFHDCVTVLNFKSTHGMLRIALIGEKVHQVEEQNYHLVCGTERLEVSYKEIMYI